MKKLSFFRDKKLLEREKTSAFRHSCGHLEASIIKEFFVEVLVSF